MYNENAYPSQGEKGSDRPQEKPIWTQKKTLSAAHVRSMSAGSAGQRQAGGINAGATCPM
jgi:hypothetical protein